MVIVEYPRLPRAMTLMGVEVIKDIQVINLIIKNIRSS